MCRLGESVIYLILSLFTGFIELGVVIYSVDQGFPVTYILTVALAYQIGALLKNFLRLSVYQYQALAASAVALGLATQWASWSLPLVLLMLSSGFQGLREEAHKRALVSTLQKRVFRVLGFTIAGFFSPLTATISVLVLLLAVVYSRQSASHEYQPRLEKSYSLDSVDVVMVIHQMHYFVYAYALPVLFIQVHGFSGFAASLAFALGWITYSITPVVLGSLPALPVVLAGHVGVSGTLALMATHLDYLPILITTWFASGFGGGTVFGIHRISQQWYSVKQSDDLDMWEDVGHVPPGSGKMSPLSFVLPGA